jgi:hypothetical protein
MSIDLRAFYQSIDEAMEILKRDVDTRPAFWVLGCADPDHEPHTIYPGDTVPDCVRDLTRVRFTPRPQDGKVG